MYTAKKLEEIQTRPGAWKSNRIGIFKGEEQIGEFVRNYDSYGESTFAPFKRGDRWYALYSPSYQSIRVMSLPGCTPIEMVGEQSTFCPVEIYIPEYQWRLTKATPEEKLHKYPDLNHHWLKKDREEKEYDQELFNLDIDENYKFVSREKETFYENFAFVSGCFWGDDSSWKIELYDISKAHEGIIKKVPEWGYYELPNLPLRQCVELSAFQRHVGETYNEINATITLTKTIRLHVNDDIKLQFFED